MDRHRVRQLTLALAVGIATVWACAARGETLGTQFTYQGRLQEAGVPVDGKVDLRFTLWDAATGGTQIGMPQDATGHLVAKGLFTVPIDFGAKAFRGDARWLAIAVDGTTLSPRQPLTATPYALHALQAPWSGLRDVPGDIADGDDDTIYFAGDGLSLVGDTFHVAFAGSGAAPTASRSDHDHFGQIWSGSAACGLEVTNSAATGTGLAGYGHDYGVYGEASYAGGVGVKGRGYHLGVVGDTTATTGEPVGVSGFSDARKGTGVYGSASATTGNNCGVEGRSNSDEGLGVYGAAPRRGVQGDASRTTGDAYGVYGTADSTSGHGVYGEATAGSGTTYGVYGASASTSGRGVYGEAPHVGVSGFASASSGIHYGVSGGTGSTSGRGVSGYASAPSGTTYGVRGESASTEGRGIAGYASAFEGTTYGVYGESDSLSGHGVFGHATATAGASTTYGVRGQSDSAWGYGVFGHATSENGTTWGVRGESDSTAGFGVAGFANATSGTTFAVYGYCSSADGWAGHLTGGKGVYSSRLAVGAHDPECGLHARSSATGYGNEVDDHVACIENSGTSDARQVLALKVNLDDPGQSCNFITFFDSGEAVGAIEGDGAGGVTLDTTSGDFAEYLPKRRAEEELSPADVVGLRGGTLSKTTRGAERVLVVSTAPAVRGNRPREGSESGSVAVAFIGQVPVNVRGAVRAGDYIVPSGREDGTGVAVAPCDLTAQQAAQVVGRALDAAEGDSVTQVRTLVGLPPTEMWQRLLERRDARIAALEERLSAIEAHADLTATPPAGAGIALGPTQGLHSLVREKEARLADLAARLDQKDGEIAELRQQLSRKEAKVTQMEERLARLEALVDARTK